jgi:hypothetical protein
MMSKRSKRKRLQRRNRIKERRKEDFTGIPAKASNYLYHFDDYLNQFLNVLVILYIRVSSGPQEDRGNLITYEKVLRKELKRLNIPIRDCCKDVCSGWLIHHEKRTGLRKAIRKAKAQNRKGINVIILSPSSDRFLRNRYYHSQERPDLIPTEDEFSEFVKLTRNVPLATFLHPDMPPEKVRSKQTKWGQQVKGKRGGRPRKEYPGYKKKLRNEKLPIVLKLNNQGKRICEISNLTGIKGDAVSDWINKDGK